MKYCVSKDFNVFVKQLVRMGWVFRRGAKHGRLISPDGGPTLTVPGSPSDPAIPNLPSPRIHAGFCPARRWLEAFEHEVEQLVPALEGQV